MGDRTLNTVRNIIFGLISKFFMLFIPFIVRTLLIYKLGDEYVGLSGVYSSILQILNVTELGFSSAISCVLYNPISKKDYKKINDIIGLLRTVYLFVGILVFILGVLILPFLKILIHNEYPKEINIYLVYLIYVINSSISYIFFGYKQILISAYQRMDVVNVINMTCNISIGLIQLITLIFVPNYYVYVISILMYTVFDNFIIAIVSKKMFPYVVNEPLSLKGISEIKQSIKGIAIGRISLMCRNSFDNIIISSLLGLTVVTMYTNYYFVMTSISGMIMIILPSMSASVGNCLVEENMKKNEKDHRKFDLFYEIIVSFCTICLFSLYQPFMKLWVGDNLMFSFGTMMLFCLYFYTNNLAQVRAVYSEAYGLWWDFRFLSVAEVLSNILLNLILGYFLQVDGIIISTIITSTLFSFLGCTIVTYKKLFKTSSKIYFTNNIGYFIVTIIGCTFIYRLINIIPFGNNWVHFFYKTLFVCLLSAIYLLFVYMFNSYSRKELMGFIYEIKIKRSLK